jgi:hypothetical protein
MSDSPRPVADHPVREVKQIIPALSARPIDHADAAVASRVNDFRVTGNPFALWPGLSESALLAALQALESVARGVLADEPDVRLDPYGEHDDDALAVAGHSSGIGPLLARWLSDGRVRTRASVAAIFAEQLHHARRRAERIAREVAPAIDALERAGTTPAVLKGFHTCHVYFPERAARRMADVDLWVPPERIAAAEAALRAAGFRPAGPTSLPYKRDWFGPNVRDEIFAIDREDERNPWRLELHGSLDRVFPGGAVARLEAESHSMAQIQIDGRSHRVLAPALAILTLACSCSESIAASRLLRVVELVLMIRAEEGSGRLDWNELIAMVERTGTARFCYPAFALVEDLAPGTVDPRVLARGYAASGWAARHTVARLSPAGGFLDRRGAIPILMWSTHPIRVIARLLTQVSWRNVARRLLVGNVTFFAPNERRMPTAAPRIQLVRAEIEA